MRVSGDGALSLTAAWACVRNISEDFAKLPFKLYEPKTGGGKTPVLDHWLVRLIARKPNNWQTPFEWREMLQGHLELRGNAFNRIIEDGRGGIDQLIPMHPDKVQLEMLDGGNFRYRYIDGTPGGTPLRRDQVWHLRGLSSDGYMGYNPVEIQRQSLGVALSRQDYAARFFANDAKPTGGWIEMTGRFADKAARDTWRKSWAEVQGGANKGKVAVLEGGMKYHEVGFNNRDSQFIEAAAMSVNEVARMFRVPPHKIGDLTRSTFSNIEQQNIEYATDCIHSRCQRWESSIASALLGEDSPLQVEFDISVMMRGDMAARSNYINTGVMNGTLTRNEAREMEGRNPLDGLDEPLQALNMVPVSDAPDLDEAAVPGKPEAPEDKPPESRLRTLIAGNAARMARRMVAGSAPSPDVLAEALAIPVADAAEWLTAAPIGSETDISAALLRLAIEEHA